MHLLKLIYHNFTQIHVRLSNSSEMYNGFMLSYLAVSFSKQEAEKTLERKHQQSKSHPHGNRLHINQQLC